VHTGTLKFFNHTAGYGFLVNDAGGADDYAHRSQLEASRVNVDLLKDGQTRLSYETEARGAKSQAINISIIEA
jgi:CspA family cold shock protein